MQYRVPKKPKGAMLVVAFLLAAAASMLTLAILRIGFLSLDLAGAGLFFLAASLVIYRFVKFDCVYRLGDEYGDCFIAVYAIRGGKSYLIGKIECIGKEELILLNKSGRKKLKKRRKLQDFTSNLIPDKRYALLHEQEEMRVYTVIEASEPFAEALRRQIEEAKKLYGIDG